MSRSIFDDNLLALSLHGATQDPHEEDTHFEPNRDFWNRIVFRRLNENELHFLQSYKPDLIPDKKDFSHDEITQFNHLLYVRSKGDRNNIFDLPTSIGAEASEIKNDLFFPYRIFKNINLTKMRFRSILNIHDSVIFGDVDFTESHFRGRTIFHRCIFHGTVKFNGCTFDSPTHLSNITTVGDIDFTDCKFNNKITFESSFFNQYTNFRKTSFKYRCFFNDCEFNNIFIFQHAISEVQSTFSRCRFRGNSSFRESKLGIMIDFDHCTFNSHTDFDGAEFKGRTIFRGANFTTYPPTFYRADIYPGTEWTDVNWPLPSSKLIAPEFVRAYERLKLECDNLRKFEDELEFFSLEMQSKSIRDKGTLKGSLISLYGGVCDYGRSVSRPLFLLGLLWAISAVLMNAASHPMIDSSEIGVLGRIEFLAYSAASIFSVFGFGRLYFDEDSVISQMSGASQFIAALEAVLGSVFLFLIILGIRNRLRLR